VANRLSGHRYAQAIFELAEQHEQLEPWDQELRLAADVLGDEEFGLFLKHAEVPLERKITAIDEVLSEAHPLVRNLVALIVSRGGVEAMRDVQEAYTHLLDERLGRQRVEVIAAVPLDQVELDRITDLVGRMVGKEVVVSAQVDESILGGLIIQIGDQLLDGSASTALERLRQTVRAHAA
jgi:F-type H+-transporting ATPase subunit delta